MASPVAEMSDWIQVFDFSRGASASGTTRTRVMTLFPGPVLVRVGLTRVAAADATIGIAEFSRAGERRGTVNFGAHPDWPPQVGIEPMGQVIVGAHVQAGIMKGWIYIQYWA